MTARRDFLAFTAGAVVARTVLPAVAEGHAALAAPLPDLLDRYSAWLDAERHALMLEMYPGCDPVECARFVPADPFASRWWWFTPPSERVLAVLSAAGIYTGPDTEEARAAASGRRA